MTSAEETMVEPAPIVRVYLLGRFLVDLRGRALPDNVWHRRKARQLFKCLLTRHRRRLTKDEAVELLWPESDPSAASTNLRSAVHALRRALTTPGEPAHDDFVIVDRDTIGLRPGNEMWVDADAFGHALAQARDAADPMPLLEEAQALYVGDYLPDDLYEDWAVERRETLKRAWVDLQFSLAHHSERRGDPDRAIAALHRLLQADPCDERAAQELMWLFLRQARRSDALRVYQRLDQSLRDELGVEPSQATAELKRELDAPQLSQPATGIVTFLFTDIEGSTRLWEQAPEAMRVALARHNALLHEVIVGHHGQVFKTMGDAFYAAFAAAPESILAAIAAQRRLHAEVWPATAELRVRMAIHTGAAEQRDGDYVGPTLNRVSRLLAVGRGGQVLISQVTADLARDALPEDADLRDLGEHRLKDLIRSEHVFQLLHPDLPADFPPLAALDARPHNLPVQRTPLIDRERELAAAQQLLLRDDVGLVTLTGPGGTGKTRLGLQVAADLAEYFEDGVYFVGLADVGDADLVVSAITRTLSVPEASGRTLAQSLEAFLRDRRVLLVLDNFEHVVEAAPLVSQLLASCTRLKVLVTSRAVLHLYGEHDLFVPPLAVPDARHLPDAERMARYDAVALFIQRSVAIKPDFALTPVNAPAVAEICARLDGLPLAIELAAARVTLLSPQAMLTRLGQGHDRVSLQLLTAGAQDSPARHRTLRGAITWSCDLLEPGEQVLFHRLAVFVGGLTLEAAEAVCAFDPEDGGQVPAPILDGLASLVDKSLLQRGEEGVSGEPRFVMLETIREYGLEQLEASGEERITRRRHAEYALALAEEGERKLGGSEQIEWLGRLEAEHSNARAALAWSLIDEDEAEVGLRLAGALWVFWFRRGYLTEGIGWLERALAVAATASASLRAKALVGAGSLARFRGDFARAAVLLEEGAALYRELGETWGLAWALSHLGGVVQRQGAAERGMALLEESLALRRKLGDPRDIARSLLNLAAAADLHGDYERAKPLLEEALAHYRHLGDVWGTGRVLGYLARAVLAQGDQERAVALAEEALPLGRKVADNWGMAHALHGLASAARAQGDDERATALFKESLALLRDVGAKERIADCLRELAFLTLARGRAQPAARLFGAAGALFEEIGVSSSLSSPVGYERDVAASRAHLDETAFAAAWTEGGAMTLEQSIEYALTEC